VVVVQGNVATLSCLFGGNVETHSCLFGRVGWVFAGPLVVGPSVELYCVVRLPGLEIPKSSLTHLNQSKIYLRKKYSSLAVVGLYRSLRRLGSLVDS
jgi:hypothetical protein